MARNPAASEANDLVVAHRVERVRAVEDRGNVARQIGLARSGADDERGDAPRRHDDLGLGGVHGGDREGPPHQKEALAHGLEKLEAFSPRLFDEMGEHLGVGDGAEDMPALFERLLQLRVIFDDAVVNDGDVARAVEVRMGIYRLGGPVGRPASVANARAKSARRALALEHQRAHGLCAHRGASPPGFSGAHQRDARGVVPAVFQSREALKQRVERVAGAYDPDDAAHGLSLLVGF